MPSSSATPSSLSRSRLQHLLLRASDKRIVVVGDAMLDVYLIGEVERISPEAPVPVVRVRDRRHALGGAANVAQNVIAIGARCDLLGVVGDDSAGRHLRHMLAELEVGVSGLIASQRCTTQKTRIVARAQQLVRVDEEDDSNLASDEISVLRERLRDVLASADALVLEDYNKGVLVPAVIREAIVAARTRGLPVVADPKFHNFFEYGGATVFKPNRRELDSALGATVNFDRADTLPAVFARLDVEHLLLTLGEQGMALIAADGEVARIPTVAREVYDVVGAGDTVTAYLAGMLAAGATVLEAALIANVAAGIEVGKLGAATVTPAEVLEYADTHTLHV